MQLSKNHPDISRGKWFVECADWIHACHDKHDLALRGMVGVPGVEPGTSSLSGTRSNQLSYTPKKKSEFRISKYETTCFEFRISCFEFPARCAGGGGKGVRTPDPELAKLVLSQLSYAPKIKPATPQGPTPTGG